MDFIKLVDSVQSTKGYSDSEMAKLTGINEYTYYGLKKYRLYLSKVAYFSISSVLGLPIEKDSEIENILEENKKIVGSPESNLSIAAECVDPDYLEKMEKELARVKKTLDTVDEKNKVITAQYAEIEKLRKEIEQGWTDLNQKIQEAYSNGVREGAAKIEIMRASANQKMIMDLNEEYTDKIDKLEKALYRVEKQYCELYKVVNNYNHTSFGSGIDLTNFEKPLALIKEEIGMVITEDMLLQILLCHINMGMSIDEIMTEVDVSRKDLEWVLKNYKLVKEKDRYRVEKQV